MFLIILIKIDLLLINSLSIQNFKEPIIIMKKIYLASRSLARKRLLKGLGLKFQVVPSKAPEVEKTKDLSYAEVVKLNALNKAQDVALRVKAGIIIGADTIIVCGGKVYGKPCDLQDARLMLKKLSQSPQWVYSGVAVIDKKTNKTRVGFEKTKVYMDKLTDKEIMNYFSCVSPLDKAGSFDIQGRGALFIRRIEGCFYNVVGLPLRKLSRMLKAFGVKLFIFLPVTCCFMFTGCSTEYNIATGEEESYLYNYNSDREVRLGQSIVQQVEKEIKLVEDPLVQKRVQDIGKKIAGVCDRKDIEYVFKVIDDDEVNAVSLPGGFIYVNKGVVDRVANDDELASVLAHEVGHVVARHAMKRLQGMTGYSILRLLTAVSVPVTNEVGGAADAAFTELMLGYSREDELLADQLGARYAKLAGYNPRAMITFLEKLQDVERRKPARPKTYFKTHPYVPDRIRVVKQELGEKMSFSDYINTEQKTHE